MRGRPFWVAPTALLAVAFSAFALAACGGGGGGTSPVGSGGSGTATTSPTSGGPAPGGSSGGAASTPEAPAAPAEAAAGSGAVPRGREGSSNSPTGNSSTGGSGVAVSPARRRRLAARHRLEAKAGAAAPFLVAQGDNSIPTYGSEASGSQFDAASRALAGYLSARAAGNWVSACSLMSAAVSKQLSLLAGGGGSKQGGCTAAYETLSERAPAAERANPLVNGVTAVRVESPHAFALFYGPGPQQYMMPMEEEDGAWKVTQIAPVAWPLGTSPGG